MDKRDEDHPEILQQRSAESGPALSSDSRFGDDAGPFLGDASSYSAGQLERNGLNG